MLSSTFHGTGVMFTSFHSLNDLLVRHHSLKKKKIYNCTYFPSLSSLPPLSLPHLSRSSQCSGLDSLCYAELLTSYPFYTWYYICLCYFLHSSLSLPHPHSLLKMVKMKFIHQERKKKSIWTQVQMIWPFTYYDVLYKNEKRLLNFHWTIKTFHFRLQLLQLVLLCCCLYGTGTFKQSEFIGTLYISEWWCSLTQN